MELKPCPFCGGECDPEGWLDGNGLRGPECEECGATARSAEAWNRRATDENAALERAAMVCEGVEITDAELHGLGHVFHGNKCAAAIRALKK